MVRNACVKGPRAHVQCSDVFFNKSLESLSLFRMRTAVIKKRYNEIQKMSPLSHINIFWRVIANLLRRGESKTSWAG